MQYNVAAFLICFSRRCPTLAGCTWLMSRLLVGCVASASEECGGQTRMSASAEKSVVIVHRLFPQREVQKATSWTTRQPMISTTGDSSAHPIADRACTCTPWHNLAGRALCTVVRRPPWTRSPVTYCATALAGEGQRSGPLTRVRSPFASGVSSLESGVWADRLGFSCVVLNLCPGSPYLPAFVCGISDAVWYAVRRRPAKV
ncbi:hypothetical protein C8Q79DRAFT_973596 [Trametes meyenii]|nr:hypothetical protein C8Q79DRAFT_973596 [Trametes meyenii]